MLRRLIFAKFFVLTTVKRFASKYSLRHKSSPLIAPYDRASNLNSSAHPGWRPDEIIFRLNGGSWIPSECAIKPMPAPCLQFYEVSAKCTTRASYIMNLYDILNLFCCTIISRPFFSIMSILKKFCYYYL